MKLGLGLGIGGSGNALPRSVTDYFNGFELSGSTYSGGPTVVADNTGALVTSPAGVLPIDGMRLTDGVWYPTDLSGDPIHASTPLRTTKGTVSKYAESYKGPLIEPARTNKVTCRKANPIDLTNITMDATVIGSIVNDPVALTAAKAGSVCTSGKVYEFVLPQTRAVRFEGATGNTNVHSCGALVRVLGGGPVQVGLGNSTRPTTASSDYTYIKQENVTPFNSSTQLVIFNPNAQAATVRIILPQLEEGAFLTSPIAKDLSGADPLTSLTRPAANLTRPTAGTALAALNNWAILIRFRPTAAGQTAVLWGSYTDANNATQIDLAPTTLTFKKRLEGVDYTAQASLTHAADTLYEALIYQHSVHGMGIAFRSWDGSAWSAWSTWVDLTDANGIANASIAATYQNGAVNNSSHVCANLPFVEVIAIPASVEPQAWLMDQLAKGRI